MDNTLSEIINVFMRYGSGEVYSLADTFAIIDNPSFNIMPNHPYRSPLSVALYCHSGSAKGRVNTTVYDMEANGFFIVQSGQITELIDTSDDFSASYILMTDSFTEHLGIGNTFSLRSVVAQRPYIRLEGRGQSALEAYLSMCRSLIPEQSNPNRLEILTLLTRAFFLGLGYFLHDVESKSDNRQTELTEQFIALVEHHYRTHRELSFYAEQMGLTPKHISLTVKASSGKSATEWIEKYVTLDAMTQLLSTNKSIKQIAYDLNFASQSLFGKYFRRVTGISPATYRAQNSQ